MAQASPIHILKVRSRWEGVARMSCCMALMVIVLSTGLVSVLYELLMYNVQDRDFRDILFDHRVTHAGRAANHVYFRETLAGLESLPASAASVSLSGVPVMVQYCSSKQSDACLTLFHHIQAAVGNVPQNCSRRGQLVWSDRTHFLASLNANEAVLALIAPGNVTVETQLKANSSNVPSADEVLAYVELIKTTYGNSRWVSPESMALPYVSGQSMKYIRRSVIGGTRTKWGIEEDISCMPSSTTSIGVQKETFPPFNQSIPQDLDISFNNRQYSVPLYSVTNGPSRRGPGRLRGVIMELSMVSALPCNAWRISSISPRYVNENGLNAQADRKVIVVVKDLTQPDAVHVPVYGGQFYIILGLFCGCFFVAGLVVLYVSWTVVTWNLRAVWGQDAPWWAFSINRGW